MYFNIYSPTVNFRLKTQNMINVKNFLEMRNEEVSVSPD